MALRLLAFQAPYKCRHRGVCCNEAWAIPVERVRHGRILDAVDAGVLRPPPHGALFEPAPGIAVDADVVVGRVGAKCSFYEPGSRLCAIHRDMGHGAQPAACQHFPRVVALDPRGVSLSLSYVCPTAADLLFDAGPGWHHVVGDGALAMSGTGWEGLDARDTLPPQVSDTLLWDWDAMTVFELEALDALATQVPEHALELIAAAAARLESASAGPLEPIVRSAFIDAQAGVEPVNVDIDGLVRLAVASAPQADIGEWTAGLHQSAAAADIWRRHEQQVSRYLASRLIAGAVVYHARSARVWSAWLQTAYAALRRSLELELRRHTTDRDHMLAALARADRLLVHRADAGRLAAALHAGSALPS